MAEQDWLSGDVSTTGLDSGVGYGQGFVLPPLPPVLQSAMRLELRPLSTGEILDRTFFLYRSRFWVFVGIASLAAAFSVLTSVAQIATVHFSKVGSIAGAGIGGVMTALSAVLYLLAYTFTQAATTSAVAAVYLGDTTSMGTALRAVKGHWFRYCLIGLWQMWSGMWIFMLLIIPVVALTSLRVKNLGWLIGLLGVTAAGSVVYGIIAYLRNSLAIPASVMESLPVRDSMRRSKTLVAGRKGRIFLMFLLLYALYIVTAVFQIPLAVLLMQTKAVAHVAVQGISLLLGFIGNALVAPVGAIALCLFYIDERVRKEGFDIEFLMGPAPPVLVEPVATTELS